MQLPAPTHPPTKMAKVTHSGRVNLSTTTHSSTLSDKKLARVTPFGKVKLSTTTNSNTQKKLTRVTPCGKAKFFLREEQGSCYLLSSSV